MRVGKELKVVSRKVFKVSKEMVLKVYQNYTNCIYIVKLRPLTKYQQYLINQNYLIPPLKTTQNYLPLIPSLIPPLISPLKTTFLLTYLDISTLTSIQFIYISCGLFLLRRKANTLSISVLNILHR